MSAGVGIAAALLAASLCMTGGTQSTQSTPPRMAQSTLQDTKQDAPIETPQDTPTETPQETVQRGSISTLRGAILREEREEPLENAVQDTRTYTDPAGESVLMQRVRTMGSTQARTLDSLELDTRDVTMRRYVPERDEWYVSPLRAGTIAHGMYFVKAGGSEYMLVTPQVYIDRENGAIEHLPMYDGTLEIIETERGFRMEVRLPALPTGVHAEYLALRSPRPLLDWTNEKVRAQWSNYRWTDANRWCFDGYYYQSESTYYPTGQHHFSNMPAAHITGKLVRDTATPAARILGIAMLDVMRAQYNEQGYIPSYSGSEWLRDDYGIAPGYYDTRFNTDIALAYLNAAENFGVYEWLPIVGRYADFVEAYAQTHHFAFGSGADEGWLVQDYGHENGNYTPTHASLNHHAAAAVFFYRLGAATADPARTAFAEKLVRGIAHTEKRWLLPSGDLHYAYLPNGSMGLRDYPDLTYNDLTELQRLIRKLSGAPNASITRLLDSKRGWMIKNKITP